MAADPSSSSSFHPDDLLKLVYITVLIIVGVLVLFLLHLLGSLRRRSSNKLLHAIVLGAYTLSYSLVSYTLGLMQESKFYLAEFPVWAVSLLMLLGGTDNLMACKLNDIDNWKSFHVKHILKGVLVVYIVAYYGQVMPEYQKPLWAILCVNALQSCVRIKSMKKASKSELLSKNVKPIVDHMKLDNQEKSFDPVTMKGYKYVVSGEHGEKEKNGKKKVDVTTVEQIWRCERSLLSSKSKKGRQLKDICLSMALSKMLNRRFAGFELSEARLPKTHDFVFKGLLVGDGDKPCERTFRVIEVELGFVYDLYYTRYPYLYHKFRHFALCLPVAMVIFCSWLTHVLYKKHKKEADNIPLRTTLFLMAVVTFLEAFQLYLHIASDWCKVALIQRYMTRSALQRCACWFSEKIIGLAFRLKAVRPWENKLGQYSLLDKYDSTRYGSYCVHYMTLFLVDMDRKGRKRGKLANLSTQVKQAVIDSLVISKGHLTNGTRSLEDNGVHRQLSWACAASDDMLIHSILVWHVATTICKNELGDGKKIAALSGKDSSVAASVRDSSEAASNLSQYCAYLVAFSPELLPGHNFDSESILDKSIHDARNFAPLQGTKNMADKCKKLLSTTSDSDTHPVAEGARLARKLTEDIQDRAKLWKVLSDFWAEMMLYVAPCDDAQAQAHLEALARGGEFITHLWALLTHAGVLERHPIGPLAAV